MKELTAEEVLQSMRNDSKRLDGDLAELKRLRDSMKKADELISQAEIRYRKDKLKKKSLKDAKEQDSFAELEGYQTRESIRSDYGYELISESEMDRLFYLWDLRESQKNQKKTEKYEDDVTKMLHVAIHAIEEKYKDRLEELEEIEFNAMQTARQRAEAYNGSMIGFLGGA